MADEGVSLPLIHKHPMMPWNDLRRGDCCGSLNDISDGFYCKSCDLFFHKTCIECEFIQHPSHPDHTLELQSKIGNICDLCGKEITKLSYRCDICAFDVDLHCVKYPPPKVIKDFETHHHELILSELRRMFDCAAKCGKGGIEFSYVCHKCDLSYHMDCIWHPSKKELKYKPEVQHSYHSLHPLKLINGPTPSYSDGKCRLCGRKVDNIFYHCSLCNFTLDMHCVLHPPPQSHMDLKDHGHQLTLLPRLDSFTCNACGLKGDRSPYICVQCNFMIHQDCLGLPRVININRHDHRISRTSVLGVVNSACGVCRKKMDWTCGGYSCHKCLGYVVHSKCATRKNVWNGKELEGIPEEIEDVESYVVIDDNTIHHFSHKEHYLRLNVNDILYDDNKRCKACTHPICLQSWYGCLDCDFILHQNCAKLPKKKWHVLDANRLTLVSEVDFFRCVACDRVSNGFRYGSSLDVICGSISEPFFHPSHADHPLYYILPNKDQINEGYTEICINGCTMKRDQVLKCIEDDCGCDLCFKCATLPQVVKHRVDDHPLSLCYGEEEASGKYWCDICEKETDPKKWFYTCKDHRASLHIKCVLGETSWLMPRSTIKDENISCEVMLNNSVTRPFCKKCESHCRYPIMLKLVESSDTYFCSFRCLLLYL
ncbi:unnamed protein product, partial [Cochlearia groenlandica]